MATAQAQQTAPVAPPPTSVHPQETSQHSFPVSSYQALKRRVCAEEYEATFRVYSAIDRQDIKARSDILFQCRDNAWFAVSLSDRTVHIRSDSCRLRWCPLCSSTRSAYLSDAVTLWLRDHPRPKLLTLTLAHSEESLDSQIIRIYASFRDLRRARFWKSAVRGGIWFFQIKIGARDGLWHPHLHILLDSEYIPHALLKPAWKRITGDSDILDIRIVRKARIAAEYVSRYCSRPAKLCELSLEQGIAVVRSLHGRRLCGKFGTAIDCDLSGRSLRDEGEIFSVISWDTVAANHATNPSVALLWQYYCSREPLPLDFDYVALASEFNHGIDDPPVPFTPPRTDPYLFPTNPAC